MVFVKSDTCELFETQFPRHWISVSQSCRDEHRDDCSCGRDSVPCSACGHRDQPEYGPDKEKEIERRSAGEKREDQRTAIMNVVEDGKLPAEDNNGCYPGIAFSCIRTGCK